MTPLIILDTGPLVAYLSERDKDHTWTLNQFQRHSARYLTCEPVLAEADHLLERAGVSPSALVELLQSGALAISFSMKDHLPAIARLKVIYQNVPMSLTDACVVRMAELNDEAKVMTLDSDFRVYRKHRRHVIPLISPF
jgi:uncharacterized protein